MQGVTEDAEHKPNLQNDEESTMIQAKSELNSKRETVSVVSTVAAQPPLQPNPPPPDSPPMIMKLKKEIEDDEYSSSNPETATEFNQPDEAETATRPPPPQSEEAAIEQPPVYTNAPLSPSSISCVENVVQYNAENGVQQSESNIFNAVQVTSTTTSPKRDCSDIDDDASSSPHGELLPRKCKNCPFTEIREQLLKNEVERRTRENQELIQKIAELDKKNAVIAALLGAYKK